MRKVSRALIKNELGASMVLVALAISAVSAGGLMMAKMMASSQQGIVNDYRIQSYRQMVDSARKALYADLGCTQAMGRTSSGPGIDLTTAISNPNGADATIDVPMGGSSILKLGAGEFPNLPISSVKIKVSPPLSDTSGYIRDRVRIHGDAVPKVAAEMTIIVEPDVPGLNIYKKDPVTGNYIYEDLFIKLFIYYEPVGGTNRLYSCHNPAGDAPLCTLTQQGAFTLDPTLSSQLKCQPDVQCFVSKQGIIDTATACVAPYTTENKLSETKKSCSWCSPTRPVWTPAQLVPHTSFVPYNDIDLELEDDDGNEVICNPPTGLKWLQWVPSGSSDTTVTDGEYVQLLTARPRGYYTTRYDAANEPMRYPTPPGDIKYYRVPNTKRVPSEWMIYCYYKSLLPLLTPDQQANPALVNCLSFVPRKPAGIPMPWSPQGPASGPNVCQHFNPDDF